MGPTGDSSRCGRYSNLYQLAEYSLMFSRLVSNVSTSFDYNQNAAHFYFTTDESFPAFCPLSGLHLHCLPSKKKKKKSKEKKKYDTATI